MFAFARKAGQAIGVGVAAAAPFAFSVPTARANEVTVSSLCGSGPGGSSVLRTSPPTRRATRVLRNTLVARTMSGRPFTRVPVAGLLTIGTQKSGMLPTA